MCANLWIYYYLILSTELNWESMCKQAWHYVLSDILMRIHLNIFRDCAMAYHINVCKRAVYAESCSGTLIIVKSYHAWNFSNKKSERKKIVIIIQNRVRMFDLYFVCNNLLSGFSFLFCSFSALVKILQHFNSIS